MGLFDKAREAADRASAQARLASNQAGGQLREAAGQARVVAGQLGKATGEAVSNAAVSVSDPGNQASAKAAARRGLSKAKSGMATVVDRIDPGLLADVVIKSTSLQERANRSLREKGSPYRINEITITAGIPPDVAFTIGRIEVEEEAVDAIRPTSVEDLPLSDPQLSGAPSTDGGDDSA